MSYFYLVIPELVAAILAFIAFGVVLLVVKPKLTTQPIAKFSILNQMPISSETQNALLYGSFLPWHNMTESETIWLAANCEYFQQQYPDKINLLKNLVHQLPFHLKNIKGLEVLFKNFDKIRTTDEAILLTKFKDAHVLFTKSFNTSDQTIEHYQLPHLIHLVQNNQGAQLITQKAPILPPEETYSRFDYLLIFRAVEARKILLKNTLAKIKSGNFDLRYNWEFAIAKAYDQNGLEHFFDVLYHAQSATQLLVALKAYNQHQSSAQSVRSTTLQAATAGMVLNRMAYTEQSQVPSSPKISCI